jgi:hypothetical protein
MREESSEGCKNNQVDITAATRNARLSAWRILGRVKFRGI